MSCENIEIQKNLAKLEAKSIGKDRALEFLQYGGFFQRNMNEKIIAMDSLREQILEFVDKNDTDFSSNPGFYSLKKFLKYTVKIMSIHIINSTTDFSEIENLSDKSKLGG